MIKHKIKNWSRQTVIKRKGEMLTYDLVIIVLVLALFFQG